MTGPHEPPRLVIDELRDDLVAASDGSAAAAAGLRLAMGRFATGVTVVTARGEGGACHAMTANSFTSISLAPPLVMVSIAHTGRFHPVISHTDRWAVSILAADQADLARHFARTGRDLRTQFEGVAVAEGERTGLPLLAGALAWLECETSHLVEAGDHTIVLGRVLSSAVSEDDGPALVYHRGGFV